MDHELRFPNLTDKLFEECNVDYTKNAIVSSGIKSFLVFSEGYKNAAINLWDSYDGSAGQANTIIYPLVFLNRQFLELRLKELICGLNYAVNHQFDFPSRHELVRLWNKYVELISKLPAQYAIDLTMRKGVENMINEFELVDPKSFSFRYPVDISPEKNPSLKIKIIDIENFVNSMTKLYNFFDVQADIIYCLIDQTDEYLQIMYSEMRSY